MGAPGCGKAAPRAALHVCVSTRVSVYLCVSAASLSRRICLFWVGLRGHACVSQAACSRGVCAVT